MLSCPNPSCDRSWHMDDELTNGTIVERELHAAYCCGGATAVDEYCRTFHPTWKIGDCVPCETEHYVWPRDTYSLCAVCWTEHEAPS